MRFEWDAEKAGQTERSTLELILRRHPASSPIQFLLRKDRVVDGEQRWHGIGAVRTAVLLVVHVYCEENPLWRRNHPHHLSAGSRSARVPNLSGPRPLLITKKRRWRALQGDRNARLFLRSTIPKFRRSPISSSPSSAVLRRNWWPCVWMPTYTNGFRDSAPAIPPASITF